MNKEQSDSTSHSEVQSVSAPLDDDELQRVEKILEREASHTRFLLLLSLPALMLAGVSLFNGAGFDSVITVAAGTVTGLLVWALLIHSGILAPGGWLHTLILGGSRSDSDELLIKRYRTEKRSST